MEFSVREMVFYVAFPVSVLVLHFLYLKLVFLFSRKNSKSAIVLSNVVLYPLLVSAWVSLFVKWFLGADFKVWLSAFVMGVVGYYLSVLMTLLPFIGIVFGELDMEFLFLCLGVLVGFSHPLWGEGIKAVLHVNPVPLFVVFVVAFIMSVLIKQAATSSLKGVHDGRDTLSALVLSICVSAGFVSVLVAILATHLNLL